MSFAHLPTPVFEEIEVASAEEATRLILERMDGGTHSCPRCETTISNGYRCSFCGFSERTYRIVSAA